MGAGTSSRTLRTSDAEEARELAGEFLYPQRMEVLDQGTPLDLVMHAGWLGPIFIGDCVYGTDIRIDPGELGSYHVNVPLTGGLVSTHRGRTVLATTRTAAVYRPVGDTVLDRWAGDCRQLCVKIEKSALDSALAAVLGRDEVDRIDFDEQLDIGDGPGWDWVRLLRAVNDQLRTGNGLLDQPLVAAPLAHGLLTGLLAAAGHPHREHLDGPPVPCRPTVINRAVEFIHEHAAEPITTSDIAAHCWISVRALQEGFQRHVGRPPLRELHRVRLGRVRAELRAANPHEDGVASIAHRWGFNHLGRFASAYQAAFGELPSTTLASGR